MRYTSDTECSLVRIPMRKEISYKISASVWNLYPPSIVANLENSSDHYENYGSAANFEVTEHNSSEIVPVLYENNTQNFEVISENKIDGKSKTAKSMSEEQIRKENERRKIRKITEKCERKFWKEGIGSRAAQLIETRSTMAEVRMGSESHKMSATQRNRERFSEIRKFMRQLNFVQPDINSGLGVELYAMHHRPAEACICCSLHIIVALL
ncbi:hypothetical protein ANN_01238 [Periplaneta americana]|uniref:Uncharacterized protein n=1 Tax=Periplaneta americana TaxID=6978 RepID=A0ABQ8TT11_PERAM|nr:hypothetical protein ANN_01238 [Periplaneta americana]